MLYATPSELFDSVVSARDRADAETYVGCYEVDATIVPQPGTVAHGHLAIRAFLEFFSSLRPSFTVSKRSFIEGPEITLHFSEWTLDGIDAEGKPFSWSGRTCDVLRRQADGGWLVAIDNPWGTAVLD